MNMKAKYLAMAAALMGAVCFSSCTQEEVASVKSESALPKVITISVAGDTRSVMGDSNKPLWEVYTPYSYDETTHVYVPSTGDQIVIEGLSADGGNTYAYYNCTNAEAGEFTLDEEYGWSNGEPVGTCVVSACMGIGYYSVQFHDYTVYIDQPGSIYEEILPGGLNDSCMVGCTDDLTKCTLHNTMALLKITVPEGTDVVYLGLGKNSAYGGMYSLESNEWIEIYDDDYDSYYDFRIGEYEYGERGKQPEDILPLEAGAYYFPMIPQTIVSGPEKPFCFKIYYTNQKWDLPGHNYDRPDDDYFTTKMKTGEVTLEAGKIYDLGTLGVDF